MERSFSGSHYAELGYEYERLEAVWIPDSQSYTFAPGTLSARSDAHPDQNTGIMESILV